MCLTLGKLRGRLVVWWGAGRVLVGRWVVGIKVSQQLCPACLIRLSSKDTSGLSALLRVVRCSVSMLC